MTFISTIFLSTLFLALAISPAKCSRTANSKNGGNTLISMVSYQSTGGRAGNYESLNISADSIIYVQGHRGDEKSIKERTTTSSWNELVSTINLTDFDKIKSNPGHALYDGIDVTITIETSGGKHSVVNGTEDSVNYRKTKPFTDLLDKKLGLIRQRITW